MKGKSEDRMLSELFRNKLGNAELIPSAAAGRSLMRKLALKQFLRFNAARFNIWYAGAAASAVALIAVLLVGDAADNEQAESKYPVYEQQIQEAVPETAAIDAGNKIEDLKGQDKVIPAEPENVISQDNIGDAAGKNDEKETKPGPVSYVRIPAISDNELKAAGDTDRNNLQGIIKRIDNYIAASLTQGCAPLKVLFKSMTEPGDSCRWTFGDGGFSTAANPEWIFDIDGEYKVTLEIFKADGRRLSSDVEIIVYKRPAARFEIQPENAIIPEDEIVFMNYSSDAVRYEWDFGDGSGSDLFEPRHKYNDYDEYDVRMVAVSDFGCTDTLTILNAYSGSAYYITFPNAFIPNQNGPSGGYYSERSDENANVFHPAFSGVAEYQLRIFSRLGILIFESNDINIGWDGYYKGALTEPGVYIWKVRGKYINGEPFTKMGDVTILRASF